MPTIDVNVNVAVTLLKQTFAKLPLESLIEQTCYRCFTLPAQLVT